MRIQDARRLTGLNLQCTEPAAIVEVAFEPSECPEAAVQAWRDALDGLAPQLSFELGARSVRHYRRGAALVCAAPIDALYAAVEANEWAVAAATAELAGDEQPGVEAALHRINAIYGEECSPELLRLQSAAKNRCIPFLWDDDEVSLGYGRYSRTWSRESLPSVDAVPWERLKTVPVVLITGTNGKTTTARLVTRILKEAGLTVGNSSTDGISINGSLVEKGDWTGPGAARAILRHPEVEVAVLETARGGILRRGLGVSHCDAAIVTNVSEDHLGEYGIHTLEGMARAKTLVFDAVHDGGYRVVNIDDPYVCRSEPRANVRSILTTLRGPDPLRAHLDAGGAAVYLDGENVVLADGLTTHRIIEVERMPMARGGAARYDIANALGAVALAWSVGADLDAIRYALADFGACWSDNPGRGQLASVQGVNVLLDFGHNPHGAKAILEMATRLQTDGGRVSVCLAQAGDRSEADLRELARVVAQFAPARVYLRDLPDAYHRGRSPDKTAQILGEQLIESGLEKASVHRATTELDALEKGLQWAEVGDLLVHLVHLDRGGVAEALRSRGADLPV